MMQTQAFGNSFFSTLYFISDFNNITSGYSEKTHRIIINSGYAPADMTSGRVLRPYDILNLSECRQFRKLVLKTAYT